MNNIREISIARLSVAAFAIDFLIICMLILLLKGAFDEFQLASLLEHNGYGFASQYSHFLVIPVSFVLHMLFVELVFQGNSLGRRILGLTVRSEMAGTVGIQSRFGRCVCVLRCFGLSALSFTTVARHNKRAHCFLHSDWVGAVPHDERVGNGQSIGKNRPTLHIRSGPDTGHVIKLFTIKALVNGNVVYVGKSKDPQKVQVLVRNDPTISGIHCRLVFKDGLLFVSDGPSQLKQSSNGTYLNGERLSSSEFVPVPVNSQIRIGNTRLLYVT